MSASVIPFRRRDNDGNAETCKRMAALIRTNLGWADDLDSPLIDSEFRRTYRLPPVRESAARRRAREQVTEARAGTP